MTTTSKYLTLIALSLLTGCATCRVHPVGCTTASILCAPVCALVVEI